ncbi:hypothetical protein ACJZ2D_016915 [Fusarium nematophilum]
MIDFTLSEAQRQFQLLARQFAREFLSGAADIYTREPDQTSRFQSTRPIYRSGWTLGLLKAQIPAPLGGTGTNVIDLAVLVEEIFAADPAISLTILGSGLGLLPLIIAGTPKQHERLLKPFLAEDGDLLASFVHSEPGGTANWLEKGGRGLQTTATEDGDSWIIHGEKLWTTNSGGWDGKGADLQCVVCRLAEKPGAPQDPSADPKSLICILIVTKDELSNNKPGSYEVLADPELAGFRASSGPHSRFTQFRVPRKNLLVPPGQGVEVVEKTFGCSAALVGAMAVGIMRQTFEAVLDFAKSNDRGGSVPLIWRQSVTDILINIKMKTEASRCLVWKALHAWEAGPGDFRQRLEFALEAKIFASDNAVESVVEAMKAVGVMSYAQDMPFSRLLNDAMCLPLFDGGNIGVRRRQLEQIFAAEDYKPWAGTYADERQEFASSHAKTAETENADMRGGWNL